ncbi:MAG TPA: hypothetical protein VN900_05740, partial [Stellaceae bacterium]|nr:hypothetical protein [Stellaceae bacterium]
MLGCVAGCGKGAGCGAAAGVGAGAGAGVAGGIAIGADGGAGVVSTGGDSVLAEFASPVEAVRCAVDFQEASRSRNLLQPPDRQLRYRIGIN